MNREFHVSPEGSDWGPGTGDAPFQTINKAAQVAQAGDKVIVHQGVYREWVDPKYGGISDCRRVVYESAPGERAVIKGSEEVKGWQQVEGTVWKVVLPHALFGDFNPFLEEINGDWIMSRPARITHLGDVYLDGQAFFEATSLDEVFSPARRDEVVDFMTGDTVPNPYAGRSQYMWHARVDEAGTTLHVNFHEADPNRAMVEVSVRKCCFFPRQTNINYITVRGFEMAHAACPWVPPTACQYGLLGTNWSRGWVIEDNLIHDAKCSGISIGKESVTGDNEYTRRLDKPGYQYQLESVFEAGRMGWSRERIGSHIIRRNTIHTCGQNGIVGHLGCIFCQIYQNHIYDIGTKREFFGWELAGIKLHAALDVHIHHNRIRRCVLGTWLDWQTQGTRVSHNLYYDNIRDFFVEVSHGPYLVEHNIMASPYGIDNVAQGGAYVNNLVAGIGRCWRVGNRATPYHLPHSTQVRGYAFVYGGDDRVYNNLYIGGAKEEKGSVGTAFYDQWEYTDSYEEYIEKIQAKVPGDLDLFMNVGQPLYMGQNLYLNGARSSMHDGNSLSLPDAPVNFVVTEEGDAVYLSITLPPEYDAFAGKMHSTATLGRVRIVDAEFEDANGQEIVLNMDYCGEMRHGPVGAGPISALRAGENRVRVW